MGSAMRRGVLWSVASLAMSKLLGLVAVLVLARLLAPDEFGTLGAVVTFLAFVQLGSDLGMQAAVVYEQEEGVTRRVHVAFTVNLGLALVLTALGMALAGPVASFFGAADAAWLFRLGILNLLLASLANVHDGLLLRDMAFGRRIVPQVGQAVAQAAVSIGLALAGVGAASLVIGLLAGTAAWVLLQWWITRFRPRLIFDKAIASTMIGYGGAAAALEVVALFSTRADSIVVGHVLGAIALGVYTLAYRLPELLISNITWMVSGVAFPALAKRRGKGMLDATLALMTTLALYTVPVGMLLLVLAEPIVLVLLGEKWEGAVPVLRAIAVTAAVHTVIFPLGDAGKAQGKQWGMVGLHLLHIPVLYVGMSFAADSGLSAVAWTGTGATVLYAASFIWWGRSSVGIPALAVGRSLLPAVVAGMGAAAGSALGSVLMWDAPSVLELIVGLALGVLGAVAALGLAMPGRIGSTAADLGLAAVVDRLPPRLRPRMPAAPAAAPATATPGAPTAPGTHGAPVVDGVVDGVAVEVGSVTVPASAGPGSVAMPADPSFVLVEPGGHVLPGVAAHAGAAPSSALPQLSPDPGLPLPAVAVVAGPPAALPISTTPSASPAYPLDARGPERAAPPGEDDPLELAAKHFAMNRAFRDSLDR